MQLIVAMHGTGRTATAYRDGFAPLAERTRSIVLVLALLALPAAAGCGGPSTRVMNGHSFEFQGRYHEARVSIDGAPIRVVYDDLTGAYRAPGCDFGPAASLESLVEQIAGTSPGSCEPLAAPPASP